MKIRNLALVSLCLAALGLGGCASMTQQCNTSIAYQDGKDDGMTPGTDMNSNYAAACLKSKRSTLNASYANGYQAGLQQRPAVAKQTQVMNKNSRD